MDNETKCRDAHRVDGLIPGLLDVQFDGRACDCGRVIFFAEQCGCAANPHMELKSRPNE
jgi:hypothetical protein